MSTFGTYLQIVSKGEEAHYTLEQQGGGGSLYLRAGVLNLPNAKTTHCGDRSSCGDAPTIKLFSLPLYNCNFATVTSHNVNI